MSKTKRQPKPERKWTATVMYAAGLRTEVESFPVFATTETVAKRKAFNLIGPACMVATVKPA